MGDDDRLYEFVLESLVEDGILARTAWRTPDGFAIYVLAENFDQALHSVPHVIVEGASS
jgi:hypothetical protein